MIQYTINDRVEVVANHGGVDAGETGTVAGIRPGATGDRITVLLDSSHLSVLMYPNELKLITNHSDPASDDGVSDYPPVADEPVDYSAITRSFCR